MGASARHAATGASGTGAPAADAADGRVPHGRPRGSAPIVGTAVPRGSVPSTGGSTAVVIGGYGASPWYLGSLGFGSYYGSYYGGYLGSYSGGYYDPWFGAYPDSGDPQAPLASGRHTDEGRLRLKIKPREAEVYVDGYLVGIVDDFDGTFERLHIESGDHRIEVRAAGYETLSFDIRIAPDHTTTYQGELKRIP
jgi:hypothetical protein